MLSWVFVGEKQNCEGINPGSVDSGAVFRLTLKSSRCQRVSSRSMKTNRKPEVLEHRVTVMFPLVKRFVSILLEIPYTLAARRAAARLCPEIVACLVGLPLPSGMCSDAARVRDGWETTPPHTGHISGYETGAGPRGLRSACMALLAAILRSPASCFSFFRHAMSADAASLPGVSGCRPCAVKLRRLRGIRC